MNTKDGFAVWAIWQSNANTAVKTTWSEQGRVKYICPVGCSEHNDILALFKTIHFNQDLVKRLFALIVAATHTRTSAASDSIDLIDENNTWCVLLCLREQ